MSKKNAIDGLCCSLNLGTIEIKHSRQSFFRYWNRLNSFQKIVVLTVVFLSSFFILTEFHISYVEDEHQPLKEEQNNSVLINFLCLLIAIIFFGGNYLPVKHYETGDGYFFQLIVCIGIWLSGLGLNWIKNNPKFYALPLLSGFIWTTGNVNSVPVIKCLGIGLGSLYWNIIGLIVGWGVARFGWFGVKPEIPSNIFLNYVGVFLCVGSIVLFLFVDAEMAQIDQDSLFEKRLSKSESNLTIQNSEVPFSKEKDIFEKMNPRTRRILGTFLSIFTGVMFGSNLIPIMYLKDNYDVSQDYNDYVFSYSTGILLGSFLYFLIYFIIKKNKPDIYPQSILPGLIVGLLWQIANTCFFIASSNLEQVITFPIVNCGPCAVAFIIGLIYGEIKGRRNLFFIFTGIILTVIGSVLCGFSK